MFARSGTGRCILRPALYGVAADDKAISESLCRFFLGFGLKVSSACKRALLEHRRLRTLVLMVHCLHADNIREVQRVVAANLRCNH